MPVQINVQHPVLSWLCEIVTFTENPARKCRQQENLPRKGQGDGGGVTVTGRKSVSTHQGKSNWDQCNVELRIEFWRMFETGEARVHAGLLVLVRADNCFELSLGDGLRNNFLVRQLLCLMWRFSSAGSAVWQKCLKDPFWH